MPYLKNEDKLTKTGVDFMCFCICAVFQKESDMSNMYKILGRHYVLGENRGGFSFNGFVHSIYLNEQNDPAVGIENVGPNLIWYERLKKLLGEFEYLAAGVGIPYGRFLDHARHLESPFLEINANQFIGNRYLAEGHIVLGGTLFDKTDDTVHTVKLITPVTRTVATIELESFKAGKLERASITTPSTPKARKNFEQRYGIPGPATDPA